MYAQNPNAEPAPARRLIESVFPLELVSRESTREKNLRHGHISTLHIWWSRKPLAASRATALAALLPDIPSKRNEWLKLIEALTPFEAVQDEKNPNLQKARALIREAFGGRAPRVLDPFAGGGSIPLEALRLGCETHALDYNPIAVLLNRCVLEYPQRFGASPTPTLPAGGEGETEASPRLRGDNRGATAPRLVLPPNSEGAPRLLEAEEAQSPLVQAVAAWGAWVLEWARAHLQAFYPPDPDGAIPVGYYWMRTIPCQNPICGAEIPLTANLWLAKKENKQVALRLVPDRAAKRVEFEIVGQNGEAIEFDPEQGTVARAHARCPVCGETTEDKRVRALFQQGRAGERMVAVVLHYPDRAGKFYRLATEQDVAVFERARVALAEWEARLREEWGMEPVPDEPLPAKETLGFRVQRYGMTRWGDLFNARQRLALLMFAEGVRQAYRLMMEQGADAEFAKAVATYLALIVSRLSDRNSVLCRLISQTEAIGFTFTRQALPMLWDYYEMNPLGNPSGWQSMLTDSVEIVAHLCAIPPAEVLPQAVHGTATDLPYPDNHFDAVLTDPPYYDNVNYAVLSDFFYVWLKRTISDLHPDLFATPLTPKSQEMVADAYRAGSREAAKQQFEAMLEQAFREMHRVLKPDGIAIIVFAHKTTEAWETVLNALLRAGLYPTAALPIHTEMQARLLAQGNAALASSIYLVCRKRVGARVGFWGDLKPQIVDAIERRLHQFWDAGVRGADLFISAIGPALAVFGQYARVERASGEAVGASVLLTLVREQVSRYALERILREREVVVELDALSQFYLLYRWSYGHAEVPFDEARKLAASVGLELTEVWGVGRLIAPAQGKSGESKRVKVLAPLERRWGMGDGVAPAQGRRRTNPEQLTMGLMGSGEEKLNEASQALWDALRARAQGSKIEALHLVAWLWESGQTARLLEWMESEGRHRDRLLWLLAQAVAEALPEGDAERRLMQGVLGFSRRWEV